LGNKHTYLSAAFCLICFVGFGQNKARLSEPETLVFTQKYINAGKEKILGNNQEAFKLYAECADLDPKNDAVHYEIGRLFLTQNNLVRAGEEFELAAKLDPNNKWYWTPLADVQTSKHEYKNAIKTYDKLRKLEPNDPTYILTQASLLLHTGKTKDAIKAFDDYESLVGLSPEVSLKRYQYFIGGEAYDKAVVEIESLIEAYPNEPQYYSHLADLYKAQGKTQKALEVYAKALKVDPENAYIQLSLAEYFERNGQRDSSFYYLDKAYSNRFLDIDTKIGLLLKMYPEAERSVVVREQTINLCSRLVDAHPDEAKSYSVQGDFFYLDHQLEKARESYYKTIELDPSKYAIWNQLLLIDSELNDETSMLNDSRAAMELFPTQPGVYLFNGIANNQKKNYKEAAKNLKIGSQLIIGNPFLSAQMLASLGDAYHELGKHTSSDSAYNASLKYDSNNLYVLNNYSYFLSLRNVELGRALKMSRKTIAKEPLNASYLDTYGWILYLKGEFNEAEKYLSKSLMNGGEKSAEVLEHYGDVLYRLNRKDEANAYWKKAKEAGGSSEALINKTSSKKLDD